MNELTLRSQKIAFIGAGSMAEALVRGLTDAELVHSLSVVVLNRHNRSRLAALQEQYGVRIPETNEPAERSSLIETADIVVFAMKPKDVGSAISEFRRSIRPEQLIVSVVAGLSITTIEQLLRRKQPIIRTMPNTSSSIGLGATGLASSDSVSEQWRQIAIQMFEAVGLVVPVKEEKLNLVTGLSGSGPAYVYYLMESMTSAGVEAGLSEEDARALTVQTVLGAAHMVHTTDEDPAELRAKVTSPNGTTFAALGVLEQYRFKEGMTKAIFRASERAQEMGDEVAANALQAVEAADH